MPTQQLLLMASLSKLAALNPEAYGRFEPLMPQI
jgi:hypothetical protein